MSEWYPAEFPKPSSRNSRNLTLSLSVPSTAIACLRHLPLHRQTSVHSAASNLRSSPSFPEKHPRPQSPALLGERARLSLFFKVPKHVKPMISLLATCHFTLARPKRLTPAAVPEIRLSTQHGGAGDNLIEESQSFSCQAVSSESNIFVDLSPGLSHPRATSCNCHLLRQRPASYYLALTE
ncbi:unnamed protein product [Cyclocybe aegerita]|uniref:Uncharacterized protein n=1 Tax=Cyclocybe aegerita TaxID=1973307 RepID=A0A8S0W4S1_CYCAE|nr:unnamed protein product [Cyclocybe aegerita]